MSVPDGVHDAGMASVRERVNANGTRVWQVRWREGGRGAPMQSVTCPTAAAAKRVKGLVDVHGYLPMRVPAQLAEATFADLLERHLDELTGVTLRTRADYRRLAGLRFGLLAGLPAASIDRAMVARLVNAWQDQGLSSKSIANAHGLLSGVFKTAVRAKVVPGNPCIGIRLPRHDDHTRRDMTVLTPDQFAHLVSHITPPYRLLVEFLAGTGLRWGELVALDVGDVDVDRAIVSVTKAQKRDDRAGLYIGPTKTARSRREVTLPAYLLDGLRPLLARPRTVPLFTAAAGGRVLSGNFHARVWQPALAAARDEGAHRAGSCGWPALDGTPRIHDLRHCHASWLLAEGVQMVVVQRRLGHESITTTIDRYSHLMPDQQAGAAEAIARALSPSGSAAASEHRVGA